MAKAVYAVVVRPVGGDEFTLCYYESFSEAVRVVEIFEEPLSKGFVEYVKIKVEEVE